MDSYFTTSRAFNIYHLLDFWRKHSSRQNPGGWESTRCTFNPHNYPNKKVHHSLCDPEDLQKFGQRGKSKLGRSSEFYGLQLWGLTRSVTNQSPARSRWSIWQLNTLFGLKRIKKLSNDQVVWKKLNLGTIISSKGQWRCSFWIKFNHSTQVEKVR